MSFQKELEYAWLAGFFDGEGCVYLKHDKTPWHKKHGRGSGYHARIILSNTHLPTMHRVKEILDGEGIISKVYSVGNPKHRTRWELRVSGNKALTVLEKILPYLVTKREQVQLTLESKRYQQKVGANTPNPNAGKLEELKQQITDLKRVEYKEGLH